MVAQRIERSILIHAPADVVWSVVTEPEHISGWFSDSVDLDLTEGGSIALHWDGHGTAHGRVERIEPPRFFSFRWMLEHGREFAADLATLVEFTLDVEGDATRLTVVETGFRDLAVPDDEKQRQVEGHTRGWKLELGHLEEYVARRSAAPADR
jgi:uncharacterized protein YndB with AHSA1/START domain